MSLFGLCIGGIIERIKKIRHRPGTRIRTTKGLVKKLPIGRKETFKKNNTFDINRVNSK